MFSCIHAKKIIVSQPIEAMGQLLAQSDRQEATQSSHLERLTQPLDKS